MMNRFSYNGLLNVYSRFYPKHLSSPAGHIEKFINFSQGLIIPSTHTTSTSLFTHTHHNRRAIHTVSTNGQAHSGITNYIIKNPKLKTKIGQRSLFIKYETTPNPDSRKFVPNMQLLEKGQSMDFPDAISAARSPLAKMLFRNEEVSRVFLGSNFVTVTKRPEDDWEHVTSLVFADLTEFLSSGEPVLLDEVPILDTTIMPEDSEEVAMIKELLETRIRPTIMDDGGNITYLGFVDGVVFVKLQGSCSSCSSSSITLKNGIERMLMHWIEGVSGVTAVESEDEFERITGIPANNPALALQKDQQERAQIITEHSSDNSKYIPKPIDTEPTAFQKPPKNHQMAEL